MLSAPYFASPQTILGPIVTPADVGGRVPFDTLVQEGLLERVHGSRAVARGVTVTPRVRVLALAPVVPPRTVVGRSSAAWVYLGGSPPERVTVLYPPNCHRPLPGPRTASHQAVLREDEVVRLGAAATTTPARTAADLALFAPTDQATRLVHELVATGATSIRAVLDALNRRTGDAAYGRALDVVRALP
ncbi:hypothetical protein HF995_08905 [Sanguibacter hominis ATCC BAA-789]|uniref:AbiEi antitoxin C-terminal domain-containing protein n=1 Tax=Sanguibacter hominis ATCC BAA-789 TaxID=1312740 RepID=A0A9X5FBZ9_9MICO|nr:hypothetical protein [Sanguibacter hominis]NKX93385.1 hypothetical protein [Sanguibacter hominis ATCC BAA-789]